LNYKIDVIITQIVFVCIGGFFIIGDIFSYLMKSSHTYTNSSMNFDPILVGLGFVVVAVLLEAHNKKEIE